MTNLKNEVIADFKTQLRGPLLQPGEPGYDHARRVWNAMIDRRPAMIVRCSGSADVMRTVTFARSHDLLLAVHGGGHNIACNAVCDGGLMLDLSTLRSIRIDPQYVMNVHTRWNDPADDRKCITWARDFFIAASPQASGGVYINFLTQDESERISDAYGKNFARLVQAKNQYDPQNLFRQNQNIRPS